MLNTFKLIDRGAPNLAAELELLTIMGAEERCGNNVWERGAVGRISHLIVTLNKVVVVIVLL